MTKGYVLPLFESPEAAAAVPATERVEIAEALGRDGDPRLEVERWIEVPGTSIALATYPLTVLAYLKFVNAGGYDEGRRWDERGWALRESLGWSGPVEWSKQSKHPNRPVIGVSWYEATAYCDWRSALERREVRIPTSSEWQAAASPDGRTFPWGNEEPTVERANYSLSRIGHACPVGCYPAGEGALARILREEG